MKDNILNVVAKLIVKYGLKKFTVDEIASELHISKKTIYRFFKGKDEMIREYFETNIASDKNSVLIVYNSKQDVFSKINNIVHSNHRYRIPINVLEETQKFYPDEWEKIQELKSFKLEILTNLLEDAKREGILQNDINFVVLSSMLARVSDMFIDADFLSKNNLKATEAIDDTLNIIFNGIIKKK